ncbi:MAG TPA: hypothetical protein VE867_02735 [Candidatus Binatia bacterium]|nr:hypothetical protein [Candidatus Binatia bacterium]
MNALVRILILAPVLFAGCRATHDVASTSYHVTRGAAVGSYKVARAVAVGSYRVATAPVHYATRKRGDESPTMVGRETPPSDVTNPAQSVPPTEMASAPQTEPRVEAERRQSRTSGATSRTTRGETGQSSTSTNASHAPSSQANFPTAKAVPDKPGYVFSPFDKDGRYVDVSGYAPGTKVKDPWTDKIFVVP